MPFPLRNPQSALMLLLFFCSALVVAQESTPTAAHSPLAVVTQTVGSVLAVLRADSVSDTTRKRQIRAIIGEHFDFAAMSSRILATNWRKADKAQRARFTGLFRELLANTYWRKISSYQGEDVKYLGQRMRSDTLATVNTVIVTSRVEIPVDYKMYLKNGRWRAYDVVIEQVSLVRNYRSSFQDIVRDSGLDGLISQLELKVAESSVEEP
jgi:phospholipid transport system substrate-binding protein